MIERYVPEITDVMTSRDPEKGVELIRSWQPNLVFLDVQMPGMTGFDVLRKARTYDFEVIFTTAFNKYAIEAIRFSALDYLLKPIDADELKSAFHRFKEKQATEKDRRDLLDNLRFNLAAENEDFRIAIATLKGTFFYSIRKIIRLEGEGNYTRIFFENDKPILASKTLKDFEEILTPYGFIRAHRSHLINKRFVDSVLFDGFIQMQDNSKIEISRRRKEAVMQMLKS
jgi:two-component system LytT family response regulator